jgi:hypothetical protein
LQKVQPVDAALHVVVGLSNPARFASRYRLFNEFRKYIADSGAQLTTVELALGDRAFEVTSRDNPNDVQLRSSSVLWHKENLINLGLRHLSHTHPDWRYVAWIDSDVIFSRADWVAETIHLLQVHQVIQMWSHSIDLGPDGRPLQHFTSFVHDWSDTQHTLQPFQPNTSKPFATPVIDLSKHGNGSGSHKVHDPKPAQPTAPPRRGGTLETGMLHTGYAWAARRDALDALGGLGDIAILGSADHHMAYALVGEIDKSIYRMLAPSYKTYWQQWQARAEQFVRRNVGYMPGTLIHNWHGSKQNRRYVDRWQILNRWQFDWHTDIRHDSQGVWAWSGNKPGLEADVRHYFSLRDEDSTSA